jgi:rhodanese-related sulfurtransferase
MWQVALRFVSVTLVVRQVAGCADADTTAPLREPGFVDLSGQTVAALTCIALINLTSVGRAVRMPGWKKRRVMRKIILLLLLLIPALALAGEPGTVCHNELAAWIKADKSISIVDIQSAGEFRAHNYQQSLATGNDPGRLKKIARRLRAGKGKVILVSTTGGADATRAAERLALGGVQRSRLLVLEGGMDAAVKNASCDCCKPASLQGGKE